VGARAAGIVCRSADSASGRVNPAPATCSIEIFVFPPR
jgi:hypothetical protein